LRGGAIHLVYSLYMERLPYIDEHSIRIAATREEVWSALASVLRTDLGGSAPGLIARLLGVQPAQLRGDWRATPQLGDTLPGFAVAEIDFPERLALRGQHRFSRYALVFELDASDASHCALRAQTWAEFPGCAGRAYRALVIGTRGHRVIVRRLLRRVAGRA
jgi:hypothetical protein